MSPTKTRAAANAPKTLPKTMRAIAKTQAGPGIELITTDVPSVAPDELLLRVHRASICGSDMSIYHWTSWATAHVRPPMVFGHEFCGRIVETGSSVRGFAPGDFVSVESHIYCGECIPCREDQKHVCQNLRTIGIDGPGGFAEYAAVPARCAWKHSDASLEDIGSLMEPLGNAVYATLCEPVRGRSVLVMGCGPQGLFAIAVAKASGAASVIAVEGSSYRRDLARKMGADAIIDPSSPDPLAAVRKAAGKRWANGVDVVLEMSGAAPAVELGLSALRNGGRMTAFGIPSSPLNVHWSRDLIFKGVRLYGITGREIFKTWEAMDRLLRSKNFDVRPVITHVYPLESFREAFEAMASPDKKCGKVVFQIS